MKGNIGIGTNTPSQKLSVTGGNIIIDYTYAIPYMGGTVNILNPQLIFKGSTSLPNGYFGLVNAPTFTGLEIGGQPLTVRENMFASKNLTIGGTASTHKLEVQGDVFFADATSTSKANLVLSTTGANNADIAFQSNTNQGDLVFFEKNTNVINSVFRIYKDPNGKMALTFDDRTTGVSIDKFKIAGDGILYAAEIKVQLPVSGNFPDYVFDKEYKLMPLAELDKYITENKHLPNINTAAEVKENGLALGDMQVKQMEKIEELSLYIIAINKRLQEVEAKNTALQNQVQALQNK